MANTLILTRSCGTHNGTFHADEVTACALLVLFEQIDQDQIFRTRDMGQLSRCEYVCDVGGIYDPETKRFDHHQADYEGSLSSAGMILKYLYDTELISYGLYKYLNETLIMGIDDYDNGRVTPQLGHCSFTGVIANFVPVSYEASEEAMEEAFFQALQFCLGHLKRSVERFKYIQACKEEVKKAMAEGNEYLYFQQPMPWMEAFFELGGEEHPAKFVLMPTGNMWKVRGIPPTYKDRMKVRKPLPERWSGLLEQHLREISGIPGAVFCHKGLFISVWKTEKDALTALNYALEN